MEGRISTKIYHLQRTHLVTTGSWMTPKRWVSTFISKILHITHSQWIFRNFMLHDKAAGYLRLKECTEATIQIDSLMQEHPSSIPADSHFLLEFDTERLHAADSDTQQYWIAAMQAALAAKNSDTPSEDQPLRRYAHISRWKAAHSIAQIRRDIQNRVTPSTWVTSHSTIVGCSSVVHRPTPHALQLSFPSNKKFKPD